MKKELWDVCQEIKSHEKVIPVCNDRDANWACNQKLFKIDVAYIMGEKRIHKPGKHQLFRKSSVFNVWLGS